jgi:hypothetical protein
MAGVVDLFCKQNALWEQRIPDSENAFGTPQFSPPSDIKCRAVKQKKFHRNGAGEVIPTSWSVLTVDKVGIGDRLTVDGESFFVIDVSFSDVIWLNGQWWGRWCFGG